jgi:signal transduction histidine kinase
VAGQRGHETFVADQRKVRASAGRLIALIDEVLTADGTAVFQGDLDRRLRHDLRTPLAEILSICELWLEDAPDQLLEGFLADLRRIHDLARDLLDRLDALASAGKVGSASDLPSDTPKGKETAAARSNPNRLPVRTLGKHPWQCGIV